MLIAAIALSTISFSSLFAEEPEEVSSEVKALVVQGEEVEEQTLEEEAYISCDGSCKCKG